MADKLKISEIILKVIELEDAYHWRRGLPPLEIRKRDPA